jgi:LysR family transcriptional regulator, hydrogen peroxide-inducible genes activator
MTLTELRYIVAVAKEKHFGRASQVCFVSQPTLSVAVKKLEDELGVQIFHRQSNEITLTPQGKLLIEQAHRVLDEAKRFIDMAKIGVDPMKGPIRLGAIYTIAPYLLPSFVRQVKDALPDIPLFLYETFTSAILEMIKQDELDCALLAEPFNTHGLEVIELYDEPYLVTVPAEHDWATRKNIAPHELASQNMLLLGAGHCFRDHVLQVCPELNRSKLMFEEGPKNFEGSSLETIRQMVIGGIGISVLPRTAVSLTNSKDVLVKYIPFTNPEPSRRIVMVYRKGHIRAPAVRALAKIIKHCNLTDVKWLV